MNSDIITCQELKELLDSKADFQLLDVRTAEKHYSFNIGGMWIPAEELALRLHELDKNKLVVTYCTMGGRSMTSLMFLKGKGFTRVKSLDGGMTAWRQLYTT